MYKENKIGPITEPCGTPQVTGTVVETKLPYFTENALLVRYDFNHFKTVPYIPTNWDYRFMRITWSIVSKAALKSNKIRAAALPPSRIKRRSLTTLKSALKLVTTVTWFQQQCLSLVVSHRVLLLDQFTFFVHVDPGFNVYLRTHVYLKMTSAVHKPPLIGMEVLRRAGNSLIQMGLRQLCFL